MEASVKELESDIEELKMMLSGAKRERTKALLTNTINELDKQLKVVSHIISRTI